MYYTFFEPKDKKGCFFAFVVGVSKHNNNNKNVVCVLWQFFCSTIKGISTFSCVQSITPKRTKGKKSHPCERAYHKKGKSTHKTLCTWVIFKETVPFFCCVCVPFFFSHLKKEKGNKKRSKKTQDQKEEQTLNHATNTHQKRSKAKKTCFFFCGVWQLHIFWCSKKRNKSAKKARFFPLKRAMCWQTS